MKKQNAEGIEYVGVAVGVIGFLIVAVQCVRYLKLGYWTPFTVLDALQTAGISPPVTPGWVGLQNIIDDALGFFPFSFILIVGGGVVASIGRKLK
jgi:hypothetical protein